MNNVSNITNNLLIGFSGTCNCHNIFW